jgi:hypothetical protein
MGSWNCPRYWKWVIESAMKARSQRIYVFMAFLFSKSKRKEGERKILYEVLRRWRGRPAPARDEAALSG